MGYSANNNNAQKPGGGKRLSSPQPQYKSSGPAQSKNTGPSPSQKGNSGKGNPSKGNPPKGSPPKSNPPKGKDRPKNKALPWIIALGALVVLFCALSIFIWSYQGINPGVTLDGVKYGGKTRAQALPIITEQVNAMQPGDHEIMVTVAGTAFTLPIDAGATYYDAASTLDTVCLYGKQGGLFARIGTFISSALSGKDFYPVLVIDNSLLSQTLWDDIAALNKTVVQPSYTFDGQKLIYDRGENGITIDNNALLELITDRVAQGDFSAITYDAKVTEPQKLNFDQIKQDIDKEPANPSLDLENDRSGQTVLPGIVGVSFDVASANAALANAPEDQRFVELPVDVQQPNMTTEQFEALLFRDKLSSVTTQFNASLVNRTINVKLAGNSCNGAILNPGDVFSYNGTVGPRTVERGYREATIFNQGTTEDGVGGGICQVSSTIYSAALHADLKIVERYNHSLMITYISLGEDATVAWGSADFRFQNNTDMPIKVSVSFSGSSITVSIWGTAFQNKTVKMATNKLSETPWTTITQVDNTLKPGEQVVKNNGFTGYTTETYRVVYIDGVEVSRTFENRSVYRKLDKLILVGPDAEVIGPPPPETSTSSGGDTTSSSGDPGGEDPGTPTIPVPGP